MTTSIPKRQSSVNCVFNTESIHNIKQLLILYTNVCKNKAENINWMTNHFNLL